MVAHMATALRPVGAMSCKDGYGYLSLLHRCQPENSRSARNRKTKQDDPNKNWNTKRLLVHCLQQNVWKQS